MDNKNIILIVIAILVIALIAVGGYIILTNSNNGSVNDNVTIAEPENNTTDAIMIDKDGNVENDTVVGDNTPRNDTNTSNETYRVYISVYGCSCH